MQLRLIVSVISFMAIVTACSGPKEPEFKEVQNVKLKAATLEGNIVISAEAVFNNPNAVGVDINKLDMDVLIDGEKLAVVDQNVTSTMAANSDFTLPLEISVPITKVFEEAKGGMLGNILKNRKIELELDGKLMASPGAGVSFTIPFKHTDEYELKMGI